MTDRLVHFPIAAAARVAGSPALARAPSYQAALANLAQKLVLDVYAPAAVLVNSRNECLYSLGPVDRYLQVAVGDATQDILTMARESVRPKLRTALCEAADGAVLATVRPASCDGGSTHFDIEVRPVDGPGEATRLICFVERPCTEHALHPAIIDIDPRTAELARELSAMRIELAEALRSSEASTEE